MGTRKGCFVLESDEDRRDWSVRGPYCEGWPIYHAVHDAESGTIYAAAASEWHGAGIWRSADLGETWQLSSEGLGYGDDGELKLSKISGLTAAHGRVLAGAEAAGIFESRDGGETLVAAVDARRPARPRRLERARPTSRPATSGMPGLLPDPDDADRFWAIVQGFGIFETTDNGGSWTPRNRGLRADWPLEHPEVGYCVHKLVMSPADHDRLYQQNHCGMHRSDDAGRSWTEITEGLPTDFGFAAAAHPHDRDSFYVIPLDPGHDRCMPDGHAAVWRTSDAGSTLAAARRAACRSATRTSACCARGWRSTRSTCRASTSARAPARCSRAPTRARAGREIASYLPGDRLRRGGGDRLAMADVHLPATLPPLFADLPRRLDVEAATVDEAIDRLDERWPGMRDRLCEPGPALRRHINVYVDRERAGLDTALAPGSRVDVIAAISGG